MSISNNADTVALLKRVENLRKWQEEEQQKLLKAHELQLQQFKYEQEKIKAKLIQQKSPEISINQIEKNDDYNNNSNELNNDENYYDDPGSDTNLNYNDNLSTIFELSSEENNTPFKSFKKEQQKDEEQKLYSKKKMLNFDIIQENDDEQSENEENYEEQYNYEEQRNDFDEIPISGKGKSFEQLLEEKLKDSRPIANVKKTQNKIIQINNENEPPIQQTQNGKKKFLKRGEGLVRYQPRSKSTDDKNRVVPKKPSSTNTTNTSTATNSTVQKSKSISTSNLSTTTNTKSNLTKTNNKSSKPSIQNTKSQPVPPKAHVQKPAQPPVANDNDDFLGPVAKTSKKQVEAQITANPGLFKKSTIIENNVSSSISSGEDDDLKEFEELEKYAEDHPSFRSNASYIETLLATKSTSHTTHKLANLTEEQSLEQTIIDDKDDEEDEEKSIPRSPRKLSSSPKVLQRKVKRINYDYVMSSDTGGSDNDELSHKFALDTVKRRLGSLDFCQTSQESLNGKLKQSQQQQQQQQQAPNNKAYDSNTYKSLSQIEVQPSKDEDDNFEDENTWLDSSIKNIKHKEESKINSTTSEPAPVSQLMTKLFPSLKPKQVQQPAPTTNQISHDSNFDKLRGGTSQQDAVIAQVLKEKVNQLELEMEKFRVKNAELKSLKDKYDNDVKNFEGELRAFEKFKQEEMNQFKAYKDEEIKKLKAEKKLFEQHKKSLKEAPSKKERDEIERLKKQVSDLQEELKTKETRWTANNNRLKDRIEILEREKDELKNELLILEKQRLEAKQSLIKQQQQPKAIVTPQSVAPVLTTTVIKEAQPKASNNIISSKHPLTDTIFVDSTLDSFNSSRPNEKLTRSTSERSLSSTSSSTRLSAPLVSHINTLEHSSLAQQIGDQSTHNQTHKTVKFRLDNDTDLPTIYQPQTPSSYFDETESPSPPPPPTYVNKLIGNQSVKLKKLNRHDDGRVEKLLEDGTQITEFVNGTIKEVSPNRRHTIVVFFNGDRKEVNQDAGTETYFYKQTNVTQITYSDGIQVYKFPNGQVEKHYPNKDKEIIFPDKIIKYMYANGTEESRLTNGTIIKTDAQGIKVIEYPNCQREVHTKDYKRREYPSGDVKTVYANGISETRYANGRVRIKDEFGNIISDKKM